ncbi:MAG: nucleotidyltransferase domain-containing protein [Anaerolineae bacterium]|nr:nucleotidyltransferase domain-containing protein [Anaerolineae bacterium]
MERPRGAAGGAARRAVADPADEPAWMGMMLPQTRLLQRVREVCQADERLEAALLAGSLGRGEGDEYSDLDVVLFFGDEVFEQIDIKTWIEQVAPVDLYFVNSFGSPTAIFDNLVRGEFHPYRVSDMSILETWRGIVWFPSLADAIILDRTGELTRRLQTLVGEPRQDSPDQIQKICYNLVNWTLFGSNVLARGETARALEILFIAHDELFRLLRLLEGATGHWISPTKSLEWEVSPAAYVRYQSCTAPAEPPALARAYRATWAWAREMMAALARQYPINLPESLLMKLDQRLAGLRVDHA